MIEIRKNKTVLPDFSLHFRHNQWCITAGKYQGHTVLTWPWRNKKYGLIL